MDVHDSLNIRYTFKFNTTEGPIDPQQGFVMTGSFTDMKTGVTSNNTVLGNKGTVKWPGYVGTIIQKCTGRQPLQYFGIEFSLTGFFVPGGSSLTTAPNTCNTVDNVNCTSSTSTTTTCFTVDNKTCMVVNSGGTPVIVKGKINCNHPNVIPSCG